MKPLFFHVYQDFGLTSSPKFGKPQKNSKKSVKTFNSIKINLI